MARVRPYDPLWRTQRNPYEKMSFARLFGTPEWKHHLETLRTKIPGSLTSLDKAGEQTSHFEKVHMIDEAGTDFGPILASHSDDLLIEAGALPATKEPPHPAFVLVELLFALGYFEPKGSINPADIAGPAKISTQRMIRVLRGESPIGACLSRNLSSIFGTPDDFWSDLQKEYDRWAASKRD
jgi:plasmid maintenance system antidote protein VapI